MKPPRLYYTYGGPRQYGLSPVLPHARQFWEFQAVVRGSIGPLIAGEPVSLRSQSLWVFAPNCPHGWTGKADTCAEVAVFHLPEPDPLLREQVDKQGGKLLCPLHRSECRWLINAQTELAREWKHPTQSSHLKVAQLFIRLQLIALESSGFKPATLIIDQQSDRVERAVYWYRQHLSDNPTVMQVAAAVGLSEVHLRRLFHHVLKVSPKAALQAVRMEAIQQLLADPAIPVELAAERFGFADASSLARAYRRHFGYSPRKFGAPPC